MKITISKDRVALDKIKSAIAKGKGIANTAEVLMDKDFIQQSRHDWCWLDYKHTPPKTGWHKIDRENKRFVKITDKQASKLKWHERLFVYQSALSAVKEKSPLALYIGDTYSDRRLPALYLSLRSRLPCLGSAKIK